MMMAACQARVPPQGGPRLNEDLAKYPKKAASFSATKSIRALPVNLATFWVAAQSSDRWPAVIAAGIALAQYTAWAPVYGP